MVRLLDRRSHRRSSPDEYQDVIGSEKVNKEKQESNDVDDIGDAMKGTKQENTMCGTMSPKKNKVAETTAAIHVYNPTECREFSCNYGYDDLGEENRQEDESDSVVNNDDISGLTPFTKEAKEEPRKSLKPPVKKNRKLLFGNKKKEKSAAKKATTTQKKKKKKGGIFGGIRGGKIKFGRIFTSDKEELLLNDSKEVIATDGGPSEPDLITVYNGLYCNALSSFFFCRTKSEQTKSEQEHQESPPTLPNNATASEDKAFHEQEERRTEEDALEQQDVDITAKPATNENLAEETLNSETTSGYYCNALSCVTDIFRTKTDPEQKETQESPEASPEATTGEDENLHEEEEEEEMRAEGDAIEQQGGDNTVTPATSENLAEPSIELSYDKEKCENTVTPATSESLAEPSIEWIYDKEKREKEEEEEEHPLENANNEPALKSSDPVVEAGAGHKPKKESIVKRMGIKSPWKKISKLSKPMKPSNNDHSSSTRSNSKDFELQDSFDSSAQEQKQLVIEIQVEEQVAPDMKATAKVAEKKSSENDSNLVGPDNGSTKPQQAAEVPSPEVSNTALSSPKLTPPAVKQEDLQVVPQKRSRSLLNIFGEKDTVVEGGVQEVPLKRSKSLLDFLGKKDKVEETKREADQAETETETASQYSNKDDLKNEDRDESGSVECGNDKDDELCETDGLPNSFVEDGESGVTSDNSIEELRLTTKKIIAIAGKLGISPDELINKMEAGDDLETILQSNLAEE